MCISFNSVDLYFIKVFPHKIENISIHFSMYISTFKQHKEQKKKK
jgi:hypothetical protein